MNFVENHRDIIWVWIRIWRRFEPNLWRTEEEEVEGKENVHVCVCVGKDLEIDDAEFLQLRAQKIYEKRQTC